MKQEDLFSLWLCSLMCLNQIVGLNYFALVYSSNSLKCFQLLVNNLWSPDFSVLIQPQKMMTKAVSLKNLISCLSQPG